MRPGQYIVIAGRPGQGKTSLGAQIARNVADNGIPAAIFSLEMKCLDLGQRNASAAANVPFEEIRDGTVNKEAIERLIAYDAAQQDYPLYIDDDSGQTVGEIALKTRKLVKDKGVKVVVIDYIQIVAPDNPTKNETQDVASVSNALRRMARKLDVVVIVLAQLNRDSAKREDNIPKLTDLRQSGQIEQDANVAILVHLPFKYDPETERGKAADIILAKNRGGITAQREMLFDGKYSRFVNMSEAFMGAR
jgi:replicative DNA helicase